ncbi:RNA-directed DNA polymerase (Reverse transcriptase) [Gossypium australe]|uniref:RNA-directed DNA polymerase (Reverse transcriptase) n=1 Tax=Gossypium australe TaxID=47621 RepID=A0A5B6W0A7_9ROSI|nr:RNA-directed DNA polymerase (Reverse transcriptase) [Gossypium australe]
MRSNALFRNLSGETHNGSLKMALVSWDSVCQPKSNGDLGLKLLKDHNTSFMMKVGDGSWKLDLFRPWVSEEIINKITSIPPLYPSPGPNRIIWGTSSTVSFSLQNAYKKVCEDTFNVKDRIWELPWKFHSPYRIRFFIWLALKHHLSTNSERVRRGFRSSSACSLCDYDYEDIVHILRDCDGARHIRDKLIPQQNLSAFYSGSLSNWMKSNLLSHFTPLDGTYWPCLFGITVWSIWKNRNLFIFQGTTWSVDEIFSFHRARGHLHSLPLPSNWVSLNTDGSVKFDEGFAASGGCVRDYNSEWIIEFAKYLGNYIVLEAELWGILDGLNLILDRRLERILIQTDSIEAINVILDDSFGSSNSSLVWKIHLILGKMK